VVKNIYVPFNECRGGKPMVNLTFKHTHWIPSEFWKVLVYVLYIIITVYNYIYIQKVGAPAPQAINTYSHNVIITIWQTNIDVENPLLVDNVPNGNTLISQIDVYKRLPCVLMW
jgi:DNA/RNA endonuclease G (NUC1)